MEYVFGTVRRDGEEWESLKTKSSEDAVLSGYQTVERRYPDMNITDSFRIAEHYKSDRDPEGNYYNWYLIDRHYRDTDRFSPRADAIKEEFLTIQEQMIDNAALDVGADFNITEEV